MKENYVKAKKFTCFGGTTNYWVRFDGGDVAQLSSDDFLSRARAREYTVGALILSVLPGQVCVLRSREIGTRSRRSDEKFSAATLFHTHQTTTANDDRSENEPPSVYP